MHHASRPTDRSDGSSAVTALECGGDTRPVGAPAASAQTDRSDISGERSLSQPSASGGGGGGGEPVSPSWRRTKHSSPHDSLGVFQTRSIFHLPRRTSSGYFSSSESDSLPSSPSSPRPQTTDRATQTPSPPSQVMQHALQRMAEAHGGGPGAHLQHGQSSSSSSSWTPTAAEDMETEAIGREIRRIGDDYNRLLLLRRMPGRHRRVVIHPNPPAFIHQEPAVLLCASLLLLLIGRIIFLQGNMESRDHSQV